MKDERIDETGRVVTRRTGKVEQNDERLMRDRESTIPVVQEELEVGKRSVETGGVRVESHVTERPVHESVNLREEHVTVDRRPVDRPLTAADADAFRDKTIEMREHAEKAVVAKNARVVEEVRVGKTATNRTEEINDTVRRTDVEVKPVVSEMRTGFDRHESTLRSHYDSSFASSGVPFDHYSHAYQYGYNLRGDSRTGSREWSTIEPEARRTWETHNKGTWERFKDAVRRGFDLD